MDIKLNKSFKNSGLDQFLLYNLKSSVLTYASVRTNKFQIFIKLTLW